MKHFVLEVVLDDGTDFLHRKALSAMDRSDVERQPVRRW
jgi:hypothetical protein